VAAVLSIETATLGLRQHISIDAQYEVETVLASIAHDLANYFETDNARFDRAKFLKACGGW
jgi:hypothetical protein